MSRSTRLARSRCASGGGAVFGWAAGTGKAGAAGGAAADHIDWESAEFWNLREPGAENMIRRRIHGFAQHEVEKRSRS